MSNDERNPNDKIQKKLVGWLLPVSAFEIRDLALFGHSTFVI
jgi:hypothetical protein